VIPVARRAGPETIDEFKEQTAQKLRGLICPDHHQSPRLRFHGDSLRNVSIQMSGCCSKLIEIANLKIAGR